MKIFLPLILFMLSGFVHAQDLVILHTNDLHSHLNGLSPEAEYTPFEDDNDVTLGGFSRIAGYIAQQKSSNDKKLLVLDAGDFLMGTLFQQIELQKSFQLNLMQKMGYDVVAIGNHEFDFGPDSLATIINKSKLNGAIPELVCSNYSASKNKHDLLNELFINKTILPYKIIEKNGYRIGIFSIMGNDAMESIPEYQKVKFENPIKAARKTARLLKKDKNVDLVIALSHSGVVYNKNGHIEGEDIKLGKAVSDIDLIISGHSHSTLAVPVQAGNSLVVQTGTKGQYVGHIEINFDSMRKPLFQYKLVEMNDKIKASKEIQQIIDSNVSLINQKILTDIGVDYYEIVAETSFDLVLNEKLPLESNLAPFVADALYHQLNNASDIGSDVVMVASGVIRNNIKKGTNGYQNINDIFNIMPLGMGENNVPGTPLAKVYVNGRELKNVMELILSVKNTLPHYFVHFSGMQIKADLNKKPFKKIEEISIGNSISGYTPIDISPKSNQLISVTSNTYMVSFIGKLKKMSLGLVNVVPKKQDGVAGYGTDFLIDIDSEKEGIQEAKEWLAIYSYIKSFNDLNNNGIPDIPYKYKDMRIQLIDVGEK
jgi:5'-nucleotidase